MKKSRTFLSTVIILLVATVACSFFAMRHEDDHFVSYQVNPQKQALNLYWKNDKNANFGSIQNLKLWLNNSKRKLIFAMNAGMYKPDGSPQGLYIENKKTLSPIDTLSASGNFYLKPNGVFYLTTKNMAIICTTSDFKDLGNIKYATQSGPMLVIDGQIHPSLKASSPNLNIRNGVGILPSGNIVFAMSKVPVNFYDFAIYFKSMGCKNALYLDGFVSRAYLPEKNWIQTDGNFGVMVAVTEPQY